MALVLLAALALSLPAQQKQIGGIYPHLAMFNEGSERGTGTGHGRPYATFSVPAGKSFEHQFPAGFDAYWVRTTAIEDAMATAQFRSE